MKQAEYKRIFRDFDGRDEELRAVTRYSIFEVMFYRSNLYTHAHRVAAITEAINPWAIRVFQKKYDAQKALILALVHDDAEIIFGDIQAGNKSKMSAAQLEEVHIAEKEAIETIARRFPATVAGYNYKHLLQEAADYSSLEAQVVCYADKYDALGEALHEIHAGNHHFITHVYNDYGRIPIPPEHYSNFFQSYLKKFPAMKPLLSQPLDIFEPVVLKDYSKVVKVGKYHKQQTIGRDVVDHHYRVWLQTVLSNTNQEVKQDLVKIKESNPE